MRTFERVRRSAVGVGSDRTIREATRIMGQAGPRERACRPHARARHRRNGPSTAHLQRERRRHRHGGRAAPPAEEAPGRMFLPLREDAICEYTKATTLAKRHRALRDDVYEVSVEPEIATRARAAIDRMLQVKAR